MLMIGIAGTELSAEEREWMTHPAMSGVILFKRNFASREQVTELAAAIRAAAPRPQLLAVDQEGGPVQRFTEGFTRLPELARFGVGYEVDPDAALANARDHAWLMASEMRAIDMDLSFAPVVDLARGNRAIGLRAFHADPTIASRLAQAYVSGMHEAGMAATLKHFPGHGSVLEDTHVDFADDPRELTDIRDADLLPFVDGIRAGADAMMMAHVRYPRVDVEPAGYSRRWIIDILRGELGFRGVVVSDDIGMAAATGIGDVATRVRGHLDAGCDLVLACTPGLVPAALAACEGVAPPSAIDPVARLRGRGAPDWDALTALPRWQRLQQHFSTDGERLAGENA